MSAWDERGVRREKAGYRAPTGWMSTLLVTSGRISAAVVGLGVAGVMTPTEFGRLSLMLTVSQTGFVFLSGIGVILSRDSAHDVRDEHVSGPVSAFVLGSLLIAIAQCFLAIEFLGVRDPASVGYAVLVALLPALLLFRTSADRHKYANGDQFVLFNETLPSLVAIPATLAVGLACASAGKELSAVSILSARAVSFMPSLLAAWMCLTGRPSLWRSMSIKGMGPAIRASLAFGSTNLEGRTDVLLCGALCAPSTLAGLTFFRRVADLVALPSVLQTQRAISSLTGLRLHDPTCDRVRRAASSTRSECWVAMRSSAVLMLSSVCVLVVAGRFGMFTEYRPYWYFLLPLLSGAAVNMLTGPTGPLHVVLNRSTDQALFAGAVIAGMVLSSLLLSLTPMDTNAKGFALVVLASSGAAVRNLLSARRLWRRMGVSFGVAGWR